MSDIGWPGEGVRPTIRCIIEDLQAALPTVGRRLEGLDHPLVEKAQQAPAFAAAGTAPRIASVTDRAWIKVKVSDWRGAVTEVLPASGKPVGNPARWWLGAAGQRRSDSPQVDFYSLFTAACVAAGKRGFVGGPSSEDSLPTEDDFDRVHLERVSDFVPRIRRTVRDLASQSIRDGHARAATFNDWELVVQVRAVDGEAYIAIGGAGITDPKLFAVILDSIPGIDPGDWMLEPSVPRELTVRSGQVVYSASISAAVQAQLLSPT